MAKRDKDQELREAAERQRIEQERRAGDAALAQARSDDATKTDEQKAAEAEEARLQQEAVRQEEADRAAAEQKAADEELARVDAELQARAEAAWAAAEADDREEDLDRHLAERLAELSPNARLLKAGTIVHLNGEQCEFPVDLPLIIPHGADEQTFASILARDPRNFALNADLLRLVYNQMNGTPLPLASQRLKPEDMTDQERSIFGL
jgi:hypothetical protein